MNALEVDRLLGQLGSCCTTPKWIDASTIEFTTTKGEASIKMLVDLKQEQFISTFNDQKLQNLLDRESLQTPIPANTTFRIQVPRSLDVLAVVRDIENLLEIEGSTRREPEAYIVLSEKGISRVHRKGDPIPGAEHEFRRYHQAIKLWQVLKRKCHHVGESGESILFFGVRRVEIRPIFQKVDLDREIASKEIETFCTEKDKEEVRDEILLTELSDFLRHNLGDTAFRVLLRRSEKFSQRLKESLAVYISTNSPAKLLEEARAEALGFSEKVERLVAGIELKALAVPAAVLLAIKDLERGKGWTSLNILLLGSTVLFSVTMIFVFLSQREIIASLKASIERVSNDFTERGLDKKNLDVGVNFDGLLKRLKTARYAAKVVVGLSAFPAVGIFVAMFWATQAPIPLAKPEDAASGKTEKALSPKSAE